MRQTDRLPLILMPDFGSISPRDLENNTEVPTIESSFRLALEPKKHRAGSKRFALDRFARTVLGYHGCDPAFAEQVINGVVPIGDWKPSANDYDWLGHGIYFWEYAPERALNWSNPTKDAKGGVIGAIIQLGNCLDLTDIQDTKLLENTFENVCLEYERLGLALPVSRNGRNLLDCLMINRLNRAAFDRGFPFQIVRCPFLEGDAVDPGSAIRSLSHMQLVVKNPANILGVFRPNLSFQGEVL